MRDKLIQDLTTHTIEQVRATVKRSAGLFSSQEEIDVFILAIYNRVLLELAVQIVPANAVKTAGEAKLVVALFGAVLDETDYDVDSLDPAIERVAQKMRRAALAVKQEG